MTARLIAVKILPKVAIPAEGISVTPPAAAASAGVEVALTSTISVGSPGAVQQEAWEGFSLQAAWNAGREQ
ncbi:hypothetical protein A3F58_04130 [Candidatus Roizmanbacteria bacterium RIFCSPHIGHO2_12_FULL_37_9b]|nr:MAG: hypothetical protein A3F58_04130 [Candidatus Roizmanbacteria bacterium RIFCSPHIGHO2_12_FULL_37_9b]